MQYLYGDKNILRALDEAEFWKRQEAEHTQVIRALVPDMEEKFVEKLKEFENSFSEVYGFLVRFIQSSVRSKEAPDEKLKAVMLECVRHSVEQSKDFIGFLEKLLNESKAVRKNPTAQTVINHIIRESQYFIGIDQLVL